MSSKVKNDKRLNTLLSIKLILFELTKNLSKGINPIPKNYSR